MEYALKNPEPRCLLLPMQGWVSVILVLFTALSLFQWHLPGVYYDEVILTNQAFALLQGDWPVIGNVSYVGAVKAYLHAPFVALFPGSVFWLRVVPVGVTLGTGWMYVRFIRRWLGSDAAALWGLALLFFHPVLLFSVRADDGPVSTQLFLEVSVLLFLHRAISEKRGWDFVLAGFCLGLGIWQKASFGGLFLVVGLFLPFWFRWNRPAVRGVLYFGVGILVGAAPLLIYYVLHDWDLPGYATKVEGGVEVLKPKLAKGWEILIGEERVRKMTGLRPELPSLTVLPLVAALVFSPWAERRKEIWLSFAALLLLGVFAVVPHASGTNARHFVLLFPLLPLPILAAWRGASGCVRRCISAFLGLALLTQIAGIVFTHQALYKTEGVWFWSNASQELCGTLKEDPDRVTMCMDWGIRETQVYLSGNELTLQERGWIYPGVLGGEEGVLALLRQYPEARWVFHAPGREVFSQARQSFEKALVDSGSREVVEAEVSEKSGIVLYRVSRVEGGFDSTEL